MAWRCRVEVGGLVLNHEQVTDPDPDADPVLPQLMSVRWRDELAELQPGPEAVSTGTVTILMATAAEAAGIAYGSPIDIRLYRPTATLRSSFHGRVGDPTIQPHEFGVMVTLPMASYRADLAVTVGGTDWPQETSIERVERIMAEAGYPGFTMPPVDDSPWDVAARSASPTSALQLLDELLATSPRPSGSPTPFVLTLYDLWPVVDGAGLLTDWEAHRVYRRWENSSWPTVEDTTAEAPLAGTLSFYDTDSRWRVTDVPGTRTSPTPVVDAEDVSWGATWARRKAGDLNTVDIVRSDDSVVTVTRADGDDVIVAARIETELVQSGAAVDLGKVLLGLTSTITPSRWEADEFLILMDYTPDSWWPVPDEDAATGGAFPADRHNGLGFGFAVVGLDPDHNPDGTGWYAGVIRGRELRCEDGELTMQLAVASARMQPDDGAVSWNALPSEFEVGEGLRPGIPWSSVDPSVTWDQLGHVFIQDSPGG